jgi:hypothetical protein
VAYWLKLSGDDGAIRSQVRVPKVGVDKSMLVTTSGFAVSGVDADGLVGAAGFPCRCTERRAG